MPINIINQRLDSVTFHQLKHLRDLEINFNGRNVTGIFGVNGCGKSSILHALACFYRSLNIGSESNYFTRFVKRVGTEAWENSNMTAIITNWILIGSYKIAYIHICYVCCIYCTFFSRSIIAIICYIYISRVCIVIFLWQDG